ncbi:MAG: fibronectin type III domain-containing protein [Brevinematales bacterium]|nr:fibronectin type III domain-containing protein [Brevinematales bacterium]
MKLKNLFILLVFALILVKYGFSDRITLNREDFLEITGIQENTIIPSGSIVISPSKQQDSSVRYTKFSFDKEQLGDKVVGKLYAKYHGISFISLENILGVKTVSSIFSVFLSFYPVRLDEGSVLARFYSVDSVNKNIEVVIKKSRIYVFIKGIVISKDGDSVDVELVSDETIEPRNWYSLSLVFDVVNSRVSMYINGIETDREVVKPLSIDLFTKEGIVEFFPEFFGYFDNVAVAPTFIRTINEKREDVKEFVSRIVDTKLLSTTLRNVSLRGRGEFMIKGRASSDIFSLTRNQKDWQDVGDGNVKGRYLQFKVIPIRNGISEFLGLDIDISYDIPPQKPSILSVDSVSDGVIAVNWRNELDDDVEYYEIFYGDYEKKYFGTDALNGVSPIRVKKPSKFYPVFRYTIKGLSPTKVYYIAIRSVRKDGTKSEYSDEVSVVPSKSVYKLQ